MTTFIGTDGMSVDNYLMDDPEPCSHSKWNQGRAPLKIGEKRPWTCPDCGRDLVIECVAG